MSDLPKCRGMIWKQYCRGFQEIGEYEIASWLLDIISSNEGEEKVQSFLLCVREAFSASVTTKSLETFKPSYASSKVKNENGAEW